MNDPSVTPAEQCPLGAPLARYQDELGPVTVSQRDGYRYLSFGNAVEQSVIDLARPHRLEHVYTQAMMLGLALRPETSRALLLGLGGGSLARALQRVRPRMLVDAVEYRQTVIDAAREHFFLADDKRLRLHCGDANEFIRREHSHYGLLMLDLYRAEGMHPVQTEVEFLHRCRQRLAADGILVSNHWCSEFRDSRQAHQAMYQVFGDQVLYLHVQGGNTIAFGFAGPLPGLQRNTWLEKARQLGLALDIPLHKLARNFWRQNAEPLQLGRFAVYRGKD